MMMYEVLQYLKLKLKMLFWIYTMTKAGGLDTVTNEYLKNT